MCTGIGREASCVVCKSVIGRPGMHPRRRTRTFYEGAVSVALSESNLSIFLYPFGSLLEYIESGID